MNTFFFIRNDFIISFFQTDAIIAKNGYGCNRLENLDICPLSLTKPEYFAQLEPTLSLPIYCPVPVVGKVFREIGKAHFFNDIVN